MTGLLVAWGVAEGIVCYRAIKSGRPPLPGELLATSGAFLLLAILAEGAPELAALIGVGIDVAALLDVWPTGAANTPAAAGAAAGAVAAAAAV